MSRTLTRMNINRAKLLLHSLIKMVNYLFCSQHSFVLFVVGLINLAKM